MTRVFISYSHRDEALRAELDAHLALLKREGVLDVWTDHEIPAGGEVHPSISQGLEEADIVLLLISQYFNNSDYCASIEMKRALERHATGDCVAVPVLLRPCDWKTAPYARLNAIPRDNRPVTEWPSQDAAFAEIVKELREVIKRRSRPAATHHRPASPPTRSAAPAPPPTRPDRRRLVGFAAAAAVTTIAGSAIFNVMHRPGDSPSPTSGDEPRARPSTNGTANAPAAGDVRATTPTAPAPSASKRVDGDRPDVATPTTAMASPPLTAAAPLKNATGSARPPRKLATAVSAASDECQRLTGLLATGALEPGDLPKLTKACNR